MKTKTKNLSEDDGSLIPIIEAEEAKIERRLETAREQGEQRVEDAEKEAVTILEQFKDEMPKLMHEEKVRRLSDIKAETDARNRENLSALSALKDIASRQKDAAVRVLIQSLFETGR